MGNLYRFCEPIVLLILAKLGTAHGYQIAAEAEPYAVTHAGLDGAAVYRTLRRLEATGCVTSTWDTGGAGPARRVYALTPLGHQHLSEWLEVMADIASSVGGLVDEGRKVLSTANRTPAQWPQG
jgi:DNA-binding PadR family transcriptional regulator